LRLACRIVGRLTAGGLDTLRATDTVRAGDRLIVDLPAADLGRVRERLSAGS
jgi:hypothetical protein